MAKYLVDGTIHGNSEPIFGDPDNGILTYLDDSDPRFTPGEIARMVRDGFLRSEAAALSPEALQAQLVELQARLAAAEGAPAAASAESTEPAV